MKTLQSLLGLPKPFGEYTGILTFRVKKDCIYSPRYTHGNLRLSRAFKVTSYEKNNNNNTISNIPIQIQNLIHPFTGTGRTMVFEINQQINKTKCTNIKNGVKEYVLLGGTKLYGYQYYDSYEKFSKALNT